MSKLLKESIVDHNEILILKDLKKCEYETSESKNSHGKMKISQYSQ